MRVAITGSSGFIGSALAARIAARGDEVLHVRRGDPTDPAAHWNPARGWFRAGALEGVDAVAHLTGVSIGGARWTASRRALLRESRVDATRTLVDHLATLSQRPGVLVTASAVGYYGDRGGEALTEDAARGAGFLADLVVDWEAEAWRSRELGVRTVAARLAPILAPDGELLQRLLPPFRMGVGGPLGSGRQWFSWVTLEDAVAAIDFALREASLDGPVNVTAPEPVTNREFTRVIGHVLHRPTVMPLPAPVLRLVFGADRANETLLISQRAVPGRLQAAGFAFADPRLEPALERMLGQGGAR